jgi:uncharacterized membrane protein
MLSLFSGLRSLWKPALLLLGTFVLGGLIGGLLVGAVVKNRVETIRSLRTADGFTEHMLNAIEPTSAQRDTLRPLLREAGTDIEQMTRQTRTQMRARVDTLWQDMRPHLTPEQRRALRRMRQRFQDRRSGLSSDGTVRREHLGFMISSQKDEMQAPNASSNP